MSEIDRLIRVVAKLRDPVNGCPWDSVQTNMSIRSYLVEEAGEYFDALEDGDYDGMRDELGDLLLQVVLNARIAEDEGRFNIEDVARSEADKMIRRHPHVFGESSARTEEEFRRQWDSIKSTEKGYCSRRSAVDGVPRSIPGLARAQKILNRAYRAGFGEAESESVLKNIAEGVEQLSCVIADGGEKKFSESVGALLMDIVKLCHLQGIHAEEAVHSAVKKYDGHFRAMEKRLLDQGQDMASATNEQKTEAWNAACGDSADE